MLAVLSLFHIAPALAGPYADMNADVTASATIQATPEAIFSYLLDFEHLQQIVPCIGDWEMSQRTFGEGASAMVRYDIEALHRRLPVSLSRADAPYRIDLEHLGNLGFTTVITLRAEPETEDGPSTLVTLLTPLNPPPWPLRPYYANAVQVAWEQCYAETLSNLAEEMAGPTRIAPQTVASGESP